VIVGVDEWEARNVQEYVRGLRDNQIVPKPRPRPPTEQFVGPLQTNLTADALAGATVLSVVSSARFALNDRIAVPLDGGTLFYATVSDVSIETAIGITVPMPGKASSGNVVTDYSAVSPPTLG
jgi:hypothetical protein